MAIRKPDGLVLGRRVACKVDTAYSELTGANISTREKAIINVGTLR